MQKKLNKFQSHYKTELSEADRNALKGKELMLVDHFPIGFLTATL